MVSPRRQVIGLGTIQYTASSGTCMAATQLRQRAPKKQSLGDFLWRFLTAFLNSPFQGCTHYLEIKQADLWGVMDVHRVLTHWNSNDFKVFLFL